MAVARGLAQRGSAVLADEPTSELDAVNRARVVLLLRAEAERGAAVVLATHDPDAAAECDAELHLDARRGHLGATPDLTFPQEAYSRGNSKRAVPDLGDRASGL